MSQPPLLAARGIKKSFGHPVNIELLRGIDFEVRPGETVAILGASGEGKSTLLNILGTLENATGGHLEWKGQPIPAAQAAPFRNRAVGFVFQSFQLLEEWTALENVLMPAKIGRKRAGRGTSSRQRAEQLLRDVGLGHRLNFPVKLLSGGERQRVAIARALMNDPELILADEPSGNLDHKTSLAIQDLLLKAVAERGKSLVLVTHDEELAGRCDRRVRLCDGVLS